MSFQSMFLIQESLIRHDPVPGKVCDCVGGVITPPWGTPRFPEAFSISLSKCRISGSWIRWATLPSNRSCRTVSK